MPISVSGIINKRVANSVQLQGTIDASLAANLPINPLVGDRYRVVVAGSFEDDASIVPPSSFFSIGDQIEFNTGSLWTKIEAGDNILDDAFGAGWNNDQDNTASRNALYAKFEAERIAREAQDVVLQTNINGKSDIGHTHTLADVTDSGTSAGLDVPAAGDAAVGEVVKGDDSRLSDNRDPNAHVHAISEVTNLQSELDGKSDDTHVHTLADVTDSGTSAGLDVAAAGDAAVGEVVKGDDSRLTDGRTPLTHTHNIADVTNLATELSGKAASVHTHTSSQITDAGDIITRDASEFATSGALATEISDRTNADTALSERIEEVATEPQFFGEKVSLRDRPGVTYPLNSSTLTAQPAANGTTYPPKTVTGATSVEINLLATDNVNSYGSPLVLNFSGCNNGSTWFGLKKVPSVAEDNQAKVTKVEVSDDNVTFTEVDWAGYFDNHYEDNKAGWVDDAYMYYPVNKRNQEYVRVTVSGARSGSFSTKQALFSGYAGEGNLQQYTLAPVQGFEDIDPFSFQSDTGDRWLYLTTSVSNIGSSTELVHETNLRDYALINNISSAILYVNGGLFDGAIGTYARTLFITPTQMIGRSGETVDLIGTWHYNGVEIGTGGGGGAIVDDAFGPSWSGDTTQGASRNALYNKLQALENTLDSLLAGALLDSEGALVTDDNSEIITGVT